MKMVALDLSLMVLAAIAAHLAPLDVLLASYAFLGPAHYLTQISWMHDRGYNLPPRRARPWIVAMLAALVVPTAMIGVSTWAVAALAAGLVLAGLASLEKPLPLWMLLSATSAAAIVVGYFYLPPWFLLLLLLVPTLGHVFGFTALFIASGFARKPTLGSGASLGLFVLSAISFAAIPTAGFETGWARDAVPVFEAALKRVADLFGSDRASRAMLGFVAFAYAYHYLNWFAKTELLRWHAISDSRIVMMATIWVAASVTYLVDYRLGYLATLPLSALHVTLEFPTDVAAARHLVRSVRSRLTSSFA
ncbi:hypothetical protein [Bradyrhizobium elkanii]